MKKLLSILLVFCSLLPVSSLAVDPNLPGVWAVWVPNSVTFNVGNLSMLLVLNEDGTMAFMNMTNHKDDQTITLDSITGKWDSSNDYVYLIRSEDSGTFPLEYHDNCLWISVGSMTVGLKKIPDFEIGQLVISDK